MAVGVDLPAVIEDVADASVDEPTRQRLHGESVEHWRGLNRLELLKHLQSLGVARLASRQCIANAFSRQLRQQGLCPKAPTEAPTAPVTSDGLHNPCQTSTPQQLLDRSMSASACWSSGVSSDHWRDQAAETISSEQLRSKVRWHLLSGSARYEASGGFVRVKAARASPLGKWARLYGECADSSCGCYRLTNPKAREQFRNLVVRHTLQQRGEWDARVSDPIAPLDDLESSERPSSFAVRYVSVGSGMLLTDFEILCGLQQKQLPIAEILVCDSAYRHVGRQYRTAFETLAAFFAPATVCAFDSLAALRKHAESNGRGTASTYVHCDAADVPDDQSKALAKTLLQSGGLTFQLINHGRGSSSRRLWRKEAPSLRTPHETWSAAHARAAHKQQDAGQLVEVQSGMHLNEPLLSAREIAEALPRARLYRVAYERVAVRSGPSTTSRAVGLRLRGEEVIVDAVEGAWVRLSLSDPKLSAAEGPMDADASAYDPALDSLHLERCGRPGTCPRSGADGVAIAACAGTEGVAWGGGTPEAEEGPRRVERWMLTDGSSLGFGTLLEEMPLQRHATQDHATERDPSTKPDGAPDGGLSRCALCREAVGGACAACLSHATNHPPGPAPATGTAIGFRSLRHSAVAQAQAEDKDDILHMF